MPAALQDMCYYGEPLDHVVFWMQEHGYEQCQWVNTGETVRCPTVWGDGGTRYVLAKVVTACGVHCRVVNEARLLDRWYNVTELFRRKAKDAT